MAASSPRPPTPSLPARSCRPAACCSSATRGRCSAAAREARPDSSPPTPTPSSSVPRRRGGLKRDEGGGGLGGWGCGWSAVLVILLVPLLSPSGDSFALLGGRTRALAPGEGPGGRPRPSRGDPPHRPATPLTWTF